MHSTELGGTSARTQETQPTEVRTSAQARFPLAPAQLGVWYAQLLDPEVPINVAQYVDVRGAVDAELLQEVSTAAGREYESVLIRIGESDGVPYQWVDPELPVDIPVVDFRSHPDPVAAAKEWMRADASAPVDLLHDRLFAGALLRVDSDRHFWYLRAHHIILDGYGALTNTMRVAERYTARMLGREPEAVSPGSLATLVDGEHTYRGSSRFGTDRAHWADRVAGLDAPTSLDGRTAPRSASNLIAGRPLPDQLIERMNTLAASQDSTPAVVLLAAFAAYLGRLTDRDEAVLSLPVTARTTAVMRRSAGMLSNIVPLRLATGVTWGELLHATRVEVAGALRHQRYRAEDIRRDAEHDGRPARRALFGPLANIMLFRSDLTLGTSSGQYHVLSTGPVEDLSLNAYYGERDRVHVDFEANPNLYAADDIARHHARFVRYLDRLLVTELDAPLADVEVATELELEVSTKIWNATDHPVDARATLVSMFEAQAARTPDAIALRFAGAPDLTYAQLSVRANRLARVLIARGIGPESLVALHIRRSPELVVAMYAVVAAGAAYVPLDPDHPADRTAHIVATARPACVLIAGDAPGLADVSVPVLDVRDQDTTGPAGPIWDRERSTPLRPAHPAYVIFTSGSTGKPKGVVVAHAAIVNRLVWMQTAYRLAATDVVLQKTPATFDVSVWEFFWPLQVGATLVLAQPDGHRDPAYLRATIAEYGVTTAHFVPSMLEAFLAHQDMGAETSLRTVFASGEALPASLAQRLRVLIGARLHNLYGPTEAAVDVTFHEVTDADAVSVPIGAPVFNTRLHVLDSRLRPVPVGAPGELYLSGVQLARGYAGAPGLSAGRFVAHPFGAEPGERMYRTGDVVRWTTNGELEYLGRTDFQVKLRGLRIEPGEIETVLASVDSVVRAVVVVRNDHGVGEQLVAYVVEAEPDTVTAESLRAAAARALPGYMVPAAYVVLDALPVNASGKLDRGALPAPRRTTAVYAAPATPVEQAVAGVFAELLGQQRIGRDDDFFALGGNSLIATQVAARLGADLGCRLGVRELFAASTVAALAELIERHSDTGVIAPLYARPRPEYVPLSLAQQRMWFLNRFEAASASYNMPFVVRLHGDLDHRALCAALADVVERHEVLRSVFPATPPGVDAAGSAAHQVVLEPAQFEVEPEPIGADELGDELASFAAAGFDLEREIPFRARIFDIDDDSCALAIVAHHIAADGLSLRVLARDVMSAYAARRDGAASTTAPLTVQYADYSMWQRDLLGSATDPAAPMGRQLDFWTTALAGAPDLLELPADRPRPAIASGRGATHRFEIPADLYDAISETARAQRVSVFMVLHAAFAALLSRLGGADDIVIGTPVAGRGDRALDDLIGMFVNTLALRTTIAADSTVDQLFAQVKDADLAAFGHAELPFEQLVEAINPARSQARHPLFQVLLAFDNAGDISFELPGIWAKTSTLDTGVTKFDLQLTVTDHLGGAGLREGPAPTGVPAEITYATDLFDESTIARYARMLLRVLRGITGDSGAVVADLPLMDTAEQRRVIELGDATAVRPARRAAASLSLEPTSIAGPAVGPTLLDAFAARAERTPQAIAVIDGASRLTYGDLADRVNRLARRLIAAGVGPETLVALGMPRTVEFVVAAYAVLTAGGAYVPLDPEQPVARLRQVLETAEPLCVLIRTIDEWPIEDVPVIESDAADIAAYAPAPIIDADRRVPLRPDNTAYVIFTSGSTGRPKGVAVPHASVVNQIDWITAEYDIDADDVVLFKTPCTFDVSVWELFAPTAVGAQLVVAESGGHRDVAYLAETIAAHSVSMTSFVPSMLTVFAETAPAESLTSLRIVLVAGEAMTAAAAAAFGAVSPAALHNLYGPTEFTVHATHAPVSTQTSGAVPIGRPVSGSQVLVLDARLRPVPDTVIGELYLSGVQVARGYHGRTDLSAARFVANPHGRAGARMYRTGDLVRRNRAGELEYLGRSDFQVKLRGQRIELGEIEAALTAAADVQSAAVRVYTHTAGELLVAYVVTSIQDATRELDSRLRAVLPSYMVPGAYVRLDAMPLTVSGKLDRKALPDPVLTAATFRAPVSRAEQTVAEIFAQMLGVGRVGLDDDFFALGGNSLVATQIAARIAARLDADVPVRMLFEYPTVGALAAQLTAPDGSGRARRPLVVGERPPVVPLSYAQQRMWFLNQFDAGSVANNLTAAVRLTGELDHQALSAAVVDVVERHESLRTIYPAVDGIARQQVLPACDVTIEFEVDDVAPDALDARILAESAAAFQVDREPPVRVGLLRLGADDHVLVVSMHHISADGWSIAPLTRDLMCAYAARCAGTVPAWSPPPAQYADYTLWQRAVLGTENDPDSLLAEQIRFWASELDRLPDVLDLPADRPRPAVASGRGARHTFTIDAGTHRGIRELARRSNASLFMVLHAAFATLLSRLSGRTDIAIGTPVAGRGDPALDELVGMFVNTLVLRSQVEPERGFTDLLADIREADLRAFAQADVPFERLVEVLNPLRSAARHPLFQVMLDVQNTATTSLELAGVTATRLEIDTRTAKFDLQLTATETVDGGDPAGIEAVFEYATDLFDAATIAAFADRLRLLLDDALADPQCPVGDLDLMAPGERERVLDIWNATAADVQTGQTLVSLFEAQAARTPDAVAVSYHDDELAHRAFGPHSALSYREFAARVNRMARLLVSIGVRPDSRVAVAMPRSLDQVVAMYAVLTAGGAYVPVDPEHPAERIGHVLRTARPVCVLTRSTDGLELPAPDAEDACVWAVLDVDQFDASDYSDAPLTDVDRLGGLTDGNAAYVIFTSGSTGRPKGVAVSHGAIVNRLVWMQSAYQLDATDVVLQKTPATFDVSVWEFFWPLQIGARLALAAPDGHRDPAYLADVIDAEAVTVAHFVPSMLAAFVSSPALAASARCTSLRMVFASGEALPAAPAHRLRELTGARLHNLYGPTEAAVDVTFHEVTEADMVSVPIGAPVFNTQVYVLDARLNPVPVGVAGELYLAGVQLARGYVARPDLTADRFVANPFGASERMYRTGDLVAWNAAGELEYLGRTDFQVKLRGLRIELGEIEAALDDLDSVARSAVLLRADAAGDQLVGYLLGEPGHDIDLDVVKASLAERIPSYMLPAAYVVLDEFPVNASGKLDRAALPAPVREVAVFRAPTTPAEQLVADVFAEVLGIHRAGLDDDFFAVGGNSLNATQVIARVASALEADLGVRELFDAPTVAAFAARALARRGTRTRTPLVRRERPARIPLSPAQQRMWFLNRFFSEDTGVGDAVDNIPLALRLTGDLDRDALAAALADLVDRHETLRTIYPDGADGPEQRILPRVAAGIALRAETVTAAELGHRLAALAAEPFDLTAETPLRAALFTVDSADHVLALILHHISADGFSLGPLARDLMTAYTARRAGVPPEWDELPVQYADYALWQHDIAASDEHRRALEHWRRTLDGLPEQLELPTDRPRPAVATHRGETFRLHIDAELHSELRELARKRETTLFGTVHAALAVLLSRLSGTADIAIGTPVAGRGDAALDQLVGMFVNTLVLRSHIDTRQRFETVLDQVRASDLEALSHAEVPFDQLVEMVAPTRARNRHPLFQVALTFQNFELPTLELPKLAVRPLDIDGGAAKFDLQFTVRESDPEGRADGMDIDITYATDLFDADTVAVLGRRFTQVLAAVAADATVVVGDIQVLSAEEQHRALYEWSVTGADRATGSGTLADRFAIATALDPAAVAVRADDRSLSYAELDEWSNRLARRLISAGVGPEALVAVALPRSVELVVALLAVVKAGGGYLPIDPAYPADRIEYVLDDARPICAVTSATTELARGWFGGPVIDIALTDPADPANRDHGGCAPVTDADRRAPLDPAATAYVIYTSGSTGRPKGVVVPHRNVLRLLDNTQRHFAFGPSDVWTLFHSYAFDFSVWELWGALLHGGTLVVVDYYTSRSPQQFRELLAAEGVTVLNQTPSAFYQLAAADLAEPARDDLALRYVIFGGEALEPQRLTGWFARYQRTPRLVNMYGITETTVHVSYRPIDAGTGSASIIGGALPGLVVRVLDDRLRPVPVGVPGEIYVSGGQLARGYLGRAALTAGRFVADPYAADGSRAYRSGDLARWTPDGELEYLGRADQQVNLRGFRIELGEIEAALLDEAALSDEAAVLREVAVVVRTDLADEPRIVAYLVAPGAVDTAALQQGLAQRLPEHMVPAAIVPVERIPLTVNGKLDRAALPAPVFETTVYRKPATPAEEIVAGVFAEVLGMGTGAGHRVGADDDFFDLGGSSLLAAKAAARIGGAFGRTVGVRAVFEHPRVAELAAAARAEETEPSRPPLVAGVRPARLPLSPAQQRMWFLNRFDGASTAYNIPLALRLTGALDIAALRAAVGDVIGRHESLRTRYPETDGAAEQLIVPAAQAMPPLDPVTVTETELSARIRDLAQTTFDITAEIPVRMWLFRLSDTEFVFAAVLHHIAADGSSIAPFVRDLMLAYSARLDGCAPCWNPPALQYADYALWQRTLLGAENDPESIAARQLTFWRESLAGLPDQLAVPTDHPRPAKQSLRGGKVSSTVDPELHAALTALGRRNGATLFMVLHAAFAALLARLSGSTDIAVGTPVAGRGAAELDEVIGMFVNTLVLRTQVEGAEPFDALIARARETDLAALSHADVPFERLVEVLNPQRSTARHPLFQVGYSFQNHERGELRLPGLDVTDIEFDSGTAQFDLHLFAVDQYTGDGAPAGLELALGYATDVFESATAERILAQLGRVLSAVVADPELAVGDIELLDGDDLARLTHWNETAHPVPTVTLADLSVVRPAHLHETAVIDTIGDTHLTYGEFDARVNRLARTLIAHGVGPESTVVLAMRRSVELVVAMYAVVRAGGAYVPVDPDHPVDRIRHILATAAPACVLTTSVDGVPIDIDVPVLEADRPESDVDSSPVRDSERVRPLRPEHPAYVIFTSGSTGLPKGVTVPHSAVVNQLLWLRAHFDLGRDNRALLKTPATFDLSVWELWSPLTTGGALVVTAPGSERDPDRLRALIAEHRVTVLHAVPSLIGMLLAGGASVPASLRHVLAIGEALPAATAAEFAACSTGTRLYNLYGPTEAAVSITAYEVAEEVAHTVPIGRPVWNSGVHVLDTRLRAVPIGVAGELYLSGVQLARGYHGHPGLTADRFVPDPHAVGARMYRTGDIVRRLPGGDLEYLERADFQVQIGGFRIELGEVESALLRRPQVRAAVAVARRDERAGDRLIAYVAVPQADSDPETDARLRTAIAAELPTYMVPSTIVVLEALPLNANGKVDRARLPEPVFAEAAFRAPAGAVEQLVAATFAEVIGADTVGADDDFFALGGNSLMATKLAARLGAALSRQVPVAAVFDAPTVAGLAAALASSEGRARPPLVRRTGTGPARLSPAQQRMWVVSRLTPDSSAYHVPAALRLTGTLDLAALTAAITDVIVRHETLRTRYPDTDAGPIQEVLDADTVALGLTPVPVREDALQTRIDDFVATGFDITAAPPVRAALFQLAATEHVLVVVLHHISADGYSIAPMTRDLVTAYLAHSAGLSPYWEPLEIQYGDFSEWQHELLGAPDDPDSVAAGQLAHWTSELREAPELLAIPTDRPRPARRDMRGGTVDFALDAAQLAALDGIARSTGTTVFSLVHSALAVLLSKLSGSGDIVIGAPVAGRGERALDDLIGMFVNTVALRTEVDPRTRFADLLRATGRRDLAALAHADVPFEQVVDALGRTRSSSYTPLFQVMFTYQNMPHGVVELPGLAVRALDLGLTEAKFDLHLTGIERPDHAGIDFQFGYAGDIFDVETVRLFADRLLLVLDAVVADPDVVVRAIDIRTSTERAGRSAGRTSTEVGSDALSRTAAQVDLPTLVVAAAAAAPDATAFTHGDSTVSFGRLAAKITTVAKAMGAAAKPETLVNVSLAGLIPGILAALGAAGLASAIAELRIAAEAAIADSSFAPAQVGAANTSDVDSEGNC
ncbi:amino acid adenylation domain-containing protein [Nocardia cyriacigeorgica]|uniref:non-ribosomal peptide synthase/polyketide synthase n=1 Tax=Nocardia cyriacigeorgica TaxID=135487 RepID=UPI0013B7B17B|nr:non-ribosomal peptide synthase/polyketide synthase [Nocardia cyriacigeorgica]NEW52222.1 amino acid adenylation domain-containing protein [Nocardia cyriacigeorgica]